MTQIYRTSATTLTLLAAWLSQSLAISGNAAIGATENIQIVPPNPKQGQTLSIKVRQPSSVTPPAVTFEGKTYKLYSIGNTATDSGEALYRALIGVPADIAPGKHTLKIGETQQSITVSPGGFGVQKIRLSKEKDNFIASPGEEKTVDAAKATASEKQLWDGLFKPPSKARISSRFGLRRMVNGRLLTDYFHSGVDYAGGLGSPVYATQGGKVIIARTGWRLHGNTVAIDHGQGVVSFYIHLSKVLVKEGETVEAGEQIGKIGATGRATGPHLHFSVYVNGNATNPLDLFERAI